jgi:hypothetical protein
VCSTNARAAAGDAAAASTADGTVSIATLTRPGLRSLIRAHRSSQACTETSGEPILAARIPAGGG